MSARRSRWWSRETQPRRRMRPSWSRSTTKQLHAGDRRARRAASRARRNCGRRRPTTSRSTGPGPRPIPTPMPRGRAHHRIGHACGARHGHQPASDRRHHGAARRDRELRRRAPTATRCAPARRAPARCATTSSAIMNLAEGAPARHHRGRRRRVRAQDRRLSGIHRGPGRAREPDGRCTGCRAARKRSSATTRRATPSPRPSSRSTTRADSWRCASATSPIWAPISARSAPTSRRRISPAASPACTTSSISTSACAACSPTRCRPRPIAAPAARRPTTRSNAWSRKPRA